MKQATRAKNASASPWLGRTFSGKMWLQVATAVFFAFSSNGVQASLISLDYLDPNWKDADKLHDANNWGENYWNDSNIVDGHWDKYESLADQMVTSWTNGLGPKDDLSCWIASAANMLARFGFGGGEAQNIYWDMVYNMSMPYFSGGWEYGGWQHEALNWYLDNRTHPSTGIYEVKYYGVYSYTTRNGTPALAWPSDPFDYAANLLSSGYAVGLVVHNSANYHAVTFDGYASPEYHIAITDSDTDTSPDGSSDDLNYYQYTATSISWNLDNYLGGIPVDYFATLRYIPVPLPDTFSLSLLGFLTLGMFRKRVSVKRP